MNKKTILVNSALAAVFLLTFSLTSAQEKPLHLKVGIYENFPLIFTTESGEVDGLYADVLDYIAEQEGDKIVVVKRFNNVIFHSAVLQFLQPFLRNFKHC